MLRGSELLLRRWRKILYDDHDHDDDDHDDNIDDDHDKSRYGEEEGNFHIIIVNDDLEQAYVALRF